jgi:hypothetical protein
MAEADRHDALPAAATVFRSARESKGTNGFLAPGMTLPRPNWLEPGKQDIADSAARSPPRRAGLSVWDLARTTPRQEMAIRKFFAVGANRAADTRVLRAFSASVGDILTTGSQHQRQVDVVRDAITTCPLPGVDGHSLVEGLRWEDDATREASREVHQNFLDDLVVNFHEIPVE